MVVSVKNNPAEDSSTPSGKRKRMNAAEPRAYCSDIWQSKGGKVLSANDALQVIDHVLYLMRSETNAAQRILLAEVGHDSVHQVARYLDATQL